MRDELYIDNQKVDISGTDIYLNYKSQLLADVKSLVASHSYSIKLPKTATNLRIISCANMPTSTTKFAYTKHAASLYRDGICLLDNVDVVLLSVSDTIDISLVWNRYPKLQNIQNVNLNEMPFEWDNADDNVEYISWYGNSSEGTEARSKNARFPQMELGQLWRNNFRHPVISLKEIMDKIAHYYELSFDYPSESEDRMNDLVIPILNRNVNPKFIAPITIYSVGNRTITNAKELPVTNWLTNDSNCYNFMQFSSETKGGFIKPIINNAWGCTYKVRVHANWEGSITRDTHMLIPDEMFIKISVKNISYNESGDGNYGEAEVSYLPAYKTATMAMGGKYTIDAECELPIMNTGSIFVISIVEKNDGTEQTSFSISASGTINVTLTPDVKQLEPLYSNLIIPIPIINYYYYLVPNLPKIKVVDFVKAVAQIFGWFVFERDNEIVFKPYQVLADNKSLARDWSEFYLSSNSNTIEYTINSDITQHNEFCYKNADEYPSTSAVVDVENEQLSTEQKKFIESKFSATSNAAVGGIVSIPIYEYNYDWDGDKQSLYERWEYSKDDNMYLLERSQNGEYYTAKFTQSWGSILDNYWQIYIGMIQEGKLITCTMLLSPLELRTLDMSIPVYIKQLGAYFAIQEIKTKADNQAEVKLIKL